MPTDYEKFLLYLVVLLVTVFAIWLIEEFKGRS